jgi:two-component system, LytTR family, response regulator
MSKHYRVVIIEDEARAREDLKTLLSAFSELEIVGEVDNLAKADEVCKSIRPDLVFCDVMLPGGTSLDWLVSLDRVDFDLIFTTSHQEFAIQAFRLAAVDYLLKPLDRGEVEAAVRRFLDRKIDQAKPVQQLIQNLQGPRERSKMALPTMSGFQFVEIRDIIRCESDNTYTTFFLKGKSKVLVSRTLKEVETILEPFGFFRVHNSHLINLDEVVEYLKGEGGQVKLSDGSVVDVSRRRKEEFLGRVKTF